MKKNQTRNDSTQYSKKIVDLICNNLRVGLNKRECFVGIISDSTYYKWLKERPEFVQALNIAEFECKKRAIMIIQRAMPVNTTWAGWWLERRHADEYQMKNKMELTGANGKSIKFTVEYVKPK